MYLQPDVERLRTLDISGFTDGQKVLFCPEYPWQAFEPQGQKQECPDCSSTLHVTTASQELRRLTAGGV